MAGLKNVYNSPAGDVLKQALEQYHGIAFQRDYVDLTWSPVDGLVTQVTVSPKVKDGFTAYVEPMTFNVNKLNLQDQLPKDACYSGSWPIEYVSFANFLLASYGLLIEPGYWNLELDGINYVLNEGLLIDQPIPADRQMTLKASINHPLFVLGTSLPLQITQTL